LPSSKPSGNAERRVVLPEPARELSSTRLLAALLTDELGPGQME